MDPDTEFDYFACFSEDVLVGLFILRGNMKGTILKPWLKDYEDHDIILVIEKPRARNESAVDALMTKLNEKITKTELWFIANTKNTKVKKYYPEDYKGTVKKAVYTNRVMDFIVGRGVSTASWKKMSYGLENINNRHTLDLLDSIGLGLFDLKLLSKGGVTRA